jgi:Putative addiction module component
VIYRALAESLGKSDESVDEAWYGEAEDRLASYDRGNPVRGCKGRASIALAS